MAKIIPEGGEEIFESRKFEVGAYKSWDNDGTFVNVGLVSGIGINGDGTENYDQRGHWKSLHEKDLEELITVLTYYLEHHVRHNV